MYLEDRIYQIENRLDTMQSRIMGLENIASERYPCDELERVKKEFYFIHYIVKHDGNENDAKRWRVVLSIRGMQSNVNLVYRQLNEEEKEKYQRSFELYNGCYDWKSIKPEEQEKILKDIHEQVEEKIKSMSSD